MSTTEMLTIDSDNDKTYLQQTYSQCVSHTWLFPQLSEKCKS